MPALKYRDPADQQFKYVPTGSGGMSQPEADARYLLSGFRNVLGNGDMQIAQRGNGPWTTAGGAVDRWPFGFTGGTVTASRVVPPSGGGSPSMRLVVAGQSAANDQAQFIHRVEDVETLQGRQVTLSLTAWAASGTPKMSLEIISQLHAGGTLFTYPVIWTLSTAKTRYTTTFTLPSTAGMTPTGSTYLGVNLYVSAGASVSRGQGIGIQNNTFDITDVQLEEGSVATPFERLPVQQQLAWCQRYFARIGGSNPHMAWDLYGKFGNGIYAGGVQSTNIVPFPVIMRALPTYAGASAANQFAIIDGTTVIACDLQPAAARMTNYNCEFSNHVASGGVQYRPSMMASNNNTTAYLDLSAEL